MGPEAARRRESHGTPYLYLVDSDEFAGPIEERRRFGFLRGFIAGSTILIILIMSAAKWLPEFVYLKGVSGLVATNQATSERLIAQGFVTSAADRVKPAVVTIETNNSAHGRGGFGSGGGVGAGIVLRSSGYIATNEHVIAGTKRVVVRVAGRRMRASVVGVDKDSDIAVLKTDSGRFEVPRVAPETEVEVGQLAIALGAPFGFSDSVSAGVISGRGRRVTVSSGLPAPRTYDGLLQTDAAINPGNSGGPLVDRSGRIVGMNSLIYSTTGLSQGVGFAIPMDKVVTITNRLIAAHEARDAK